VRQGVHTRRQLRCPPFESSQLACCESALGVSTSRRFLSRDAIESFFAKLSNPGSTATSFNPSPTSRLQSVDALKRTPPNLRLDTGPGKIIATVRRGLKCSIRFTTQARARRFDSRRATQQNAAPAYFTREVIYASPKVRRKVRGIISNMTHSLRMSGAKSPLMPKARAVGIAASTLAIETIRNQ
jgi:hypothetical protein